MISHRKCFPRGPLKIKCLYRCCKIQKIIIFLMILYFTQKSVLGSSFIYYFPIFCCIIIPGIIKCIIYICDPLLRCHFPIALIRNIKDNMSSYAKPAYRFVLLQKEVLFSLLNPKNKVHTKIFLKIWNTPPGIHAVPQSKNTQTIQYL